MNTLAVFRVARQFKAESGQPGAGRNKTGKSGADLEVNVADDRLDALGPDDGAENRERVLSDAAQLCGV